MEEVTREEVAEAAVEGAERTRESLKSALLKMAVAAIIYHLQATTSHRMKDVIEASRESSLDLEAMADAIAEFHYPAAEDMN